MRKLVVTMWITLDGYIAGPDGEVDFILGDDELAAYEIDVVTNADTLLFGRKTYEDFSGYWPQVPSNPDAQEWEKVHARNMSDRRKIVLSKTLERADWDHSEIMRDLDPREIERLKREPGTDILIYGSASVVRQLTALGLIDEYQLLVHPVFLGGGTPLFDHTKQRVSMNLVASRPFRSGIVLLTYRPVERTS